MFPYIDRVKIRLKNTTPGDIKVGYETLKEGETKDIPVSTLHPPALMHAKHNGVEYVGLVIKNRLWNLELAEGEEPLPDPLVVPEPEEPEAVEEAPEEPEPVEEVAEEPDEPEAEEEPEVEEEELDLHDMYKKELVELAESKGMDVSGLKKDEIIEMLEGL